MDFFIMVQDVSIFDVPEPVGFSEAMDIEAVKAGAYQFLNRDAVQLFVRENDAYEYTDFVQKPVPLISNRLKGVFDKEQKHIFYKPVVLANLEMSRQDLYWLIVPDKIECLSPDSEFNKNGTLKNIVINKNKTGYCKVFRIAGIIEDFIVVRQDVAHSALQEGICGVVFKKIETTFLK